MILDENSVLPYLKKKVQRMQSDRSRHLLCPQCETRTKLNRLGDGRRKCTKCGKKFKVNKITDRTRLRQCAQILLCFCLDFSVQRTVHLTHLRSALVSLYYDRFREVLTGVAAEEDSVQSLSKPKSPARSVRRSQKPDVMARKIIDLMPKDFLVTWHVKDR